MSALVLEGVMKRFGSNVALSGMSFSIPRGSICGLIGPNGAGKTTAFGVVAGLIRPDAGRVDVLGDGPFDPRRHRGRLTLLPQDCELSPYVPVQKLLAYFAELQGMSGAEASRDARRVLDMVGLGDRAGQKIGQLSHGMRRRITIAQALLGDPELVLLDEPTSGLDPELVVKMRDLFVQQRGERTLIISSHILSELEATCDYVVFVDDGAVTESGTLDEVTQTRPIVRFQLSGDPPLDAVRQAAPGWRVDRDGRDVIVEGDENATVEDVTARVLPALLDAGVGIRAVRSGQSLEDTYMASRKQR